jgi:hypothetical protein
MLARLPPMKSKKTKSTSRRKSTSSSASIPARLPNECSPKLKDWASLGFGRWFPTAEGEPEIGSECDRCGRLCAAVDLEPLIPPFKSYEEEEWWCKECRIR